jgi:hypothetical protein
MPAFFMPVWLLAAMSGDWSPRCAGSRLVAIGKNGKHYKSGNAD